MKIKTKPPTLAEHYAQMLVSLMERAKDDQLNATGRALVAHCRQAMMTETQCDE